MNWKNCSFLGATLLLLWAAASVAGEAPPNRAQWREAYRRPAEIPFPEEPVQIILVGRRGRGIG